MEFTVRAFELPLHYADAGTWQLLRECWRQGRRLANWAQVEMLHQDDPESDTPPDFDLYARAFGRAVAKPSYSTHYEVDGKRVSRKTPGAKQIRTLNGKDLIPRKAAFPRGEFFAGAMASAASIIEDVQANYRRDRYNVLVRNLRSWRSYRSVPWPVHGQRVKSAWLDDNGRPCLLLTLPGGDVELRMRNGREFGRQMAQFKTLVGQATREQPFTGPFTEVVLREKHCRGGDVMVKLVAKMPVRERTGDRTLVLLTDPQAFWVAELDGRQAWVDNADNIRRLVARHQQHLREVQRLGQDAKAERRLQSNRAWQQQTRLDMLCENDHNRLASFTHEIACHLAEFARRQRVAEVFYLDRDRGFIPMFPWANLHTKLANKLKDRSITLYSESGFGVVPSLDATQKDGVIDLDTPESKETETWLRITKLREMATRKILHARSRSASHPKVSAHPGT